MKAEDTSFLNLLGGGQRQFVIPVFQRDYSWTEAQCSQLLADLLRVAERPAGATHFVGSVVYVAGEELSAMLPQWLVIDGQQRLTTCTLLLTVVRERLRKSSSSMLETDSPEAINDLYLINRHAPPALRGRLALRGDDQVCLQALLLGHPVPDKPHNRVLANARFFEAALTEVDELKVLTGLKRLMVVSVLLKAGQDDPQAIFESLNSTGMALAQADLVRNYVLMGHAEPCQTQWYERYWRPLEHAFGVHYRASFDSFLRDMLALELDPVRPIKLEHVYREFRHWYSKAADDGARGELLDRLLRFGRHYAAFMFGDRFTGAVELGLRRLQQLVDVASPVAMVLLERWQVDHTLSEAELVQALGLLESYVLRRSVLGAETRSGGQLFAALAQRVAKDRPLARLQVALMRPAKGAEFPGDAEFIQALVAQDLYGRRNLKFLLERLTNAGKEKVVTDSLTIEHVLPQKDDLSLEWQQMLGPDWRDVRARCLHKLGNLTLTGFNSELQARPFTEKKSHAEWGYTNSPVWLSKSISAEAEWGPQQIENRGTLLASKAVQVWPMLVADAAMAKQVELELERERSAGLSVDELKWTPGVRNWFDQVRAAIVGCGEEVVELPRMKSVVYRAPDWFAEVVPRAHGFTLRLAADADELSTIDPDVEDAAQWAFIVNSSVTGGSLFVVGAATQVEIACALVRRTFELMQP